MSKDNGFAPALILTIIVLVTTSLLALTSGLTETARIEQDKLAANRDRQALYPNAAAFEQLDLTAYQAQFPAVSEAYAVRDSSGQLMGFALKSAHRGYAGNVPVLVAVSPARQIIRALVLANEETPGLGKKVAEKPFIGQFAGKDATKIYTVKPNETDKELIDAVAGATISSRAVTMAINEACALYQKLAPEVK
jgi:electron transport complex protein RnfG